MMAAMIIIWNEKRPGIAPGRSSLRQTGASGR
jgi:hypothetical protein